MPDKKTHQHEPKQDSPSQLDSLKQQVDQLTQALQLERADAVNIRRRAEADKLQLANYFKANVIKDLLPFIDNFDLSLKHLPKDSKAQNEWIKGIESLNRQLWQILDTLGLEKIETVGQDFDPKVHEAVSVDESNNGLKEIVQEEFRSGYTLKDEIIRPAMVKVTRK